MISGIEILFLVWLSLVWFFSQRQRSWRKWLKRETTLSSHNCCWVISVLDDEAETQLWQETACDEVHLATKPSYLESQGPSTDWAGNWILNQAFPPRCSPCLIYKIHGVIELGWNKSSSPAHPWLLGSSGVSCQAWCVLSCPKLSSALERAHDLSRAVLVLTCAWGSCTSPAVSCSSWGKGSPNFSHLLNKCLPRSALGRELCHSSSSCT